MRPLRIPLLMLLAGGLVLTHLIGAAPVAAMEDDLCLGCHTDRDMVSGKRLIDQLRFAQTPHAEVGCGSCHPDVGDDHPADGLKVTRAECADCHGEVQEAFAASAHGEYAQCTSCHNPHQVAAPTEVSGYDMNRMCAGCHDPADTVALHGRWLPQAERHIGAVPCITCHTASQDYVTTLYLIEQVKAFGDFDLASAEELQQRAGNGSVAALVDTDGDGKVSLGELRSVRKNDQLKGLNLVGMMTPEKVTHSLQILDNRWDCTFCHVAGPKAVQAVYLALPQPEGVYDRLAVERGGVMDIVYGTDFYMTGVTRNKVISIVGLLIFGSGFILPVVHGTLRLLTIKRRQEKGNPHG